MSVNIDEHCNNHVTDVYREVKPRKMTEEELMKLIDEYRDKNVQLETERDTYKHALEILTSRLESAPKSHKTVADFRIINLARKYESDSGKWHSAAEHISNLVKNEGYEPYGYIQDTKYNLFKVKL